MATEAELKQEYEAKLTALQAKLDEATAEKTKADERSENAQKVIADHRAKMSEDAEYKKASEGKIYELLDAKLKADKERDEAREPKEQLQGEVAELKKQKPGPAREERPTREQTQGQIEKLTKELSEQDQKALTAVIEKADQATQDAVNAAEPTDEQLQVRLNLLKALRAENPAPSVPFWKRQTSEQKPQGEKNTDVDGLRKLFKSVKQGAEYVPDGGGGGAGRMRGSNRPESVKQQKSSRVYE